MNAPFPKHANEAARPPLTLLIAAPRGFWSTHEREMKAFEAALQG